jgi:glycine cleavage system aminomethyltransferase T
MFAEKAAAAAQAGGADIYRVPPTVLPSSKGFADRVQSDAGHGARAMSTTAKPSAGGADVYRVPPTTMPPWINELTNSRSMKRTLQPLGDKAAATSAGPTPETHGGLPPKQAEHHMYDELIKKGGNFFPFNPDYHWMPYYGGESAPAWENPKDNPKVGWADHVMGEAENAMTNCGIDLPVFGVIDVTGPKAFEFLDRMCTKKCSRKVGDLRLGYTLNKEGILWNDVSVATRGENDVYFIGLAGFGKYEMDQLEGCMSEFGYSSSDVNLVNRSYEQQLFHVFGPKAPKILAEVLGQEVTDVPFFKFREMTVKGIPIMAFHMSYAGLPGWELHTTREHAPKLYDMLLSHPLSKAEGFKPCGVMGIQSFRTEMWFRGTPDVKGASHYTEGMIDHAIGTKGGFYGEDKTYEKKKQIVMMTADVPRDYEWSLFGAQYPVYYKGAKVGHTLHSAYGARSKKTHAFAVIDVEVQAPGNTFTIQAHDQEMRAFQLNEPLVASTFRS